ncbi:MAG: hypothetical protein A3D24_04485 [Candidatus Blackburnbacteria bacterium RIFCSPHIGHO2_02_FULL_39_13]|uniref:Glycoside hydrolase family 5 domain-containing protein n=2 Tax=Patescibacteria group TaxID=1783273 RepID=A0A0G1D354_9BACT|nr:MAG: hypothetical protein UV20_C0012G0014 [Candidatus Magasanikbacteria bacterium GW2011_GWA2_42_32]OGY08574.1 MAG: hypothetical protein A3D24_04485 [Candidatus Blackburnbacteria bacterium RIFCSPHIGHO2_02_FULL_39_13]OGY13472.1 MAG: hypothetical protein A3A77_00065 [Candidatus Blackburnbacteria bacterium RIFCSPLOWO2_01_FULL_40_20]OGY14996.1 MAG: hypothetical protein A3I52_01360 [Candidatus Blackburnbacteria bacterium RIFCSPLOWO2_02_FULL_40_10]HBL52408.1 hypothetical protein [Candidatus Blackb
MKILLSFMLSVLLLGFLVKPSLATSDPLSVSNNVFGIHVIDENDLIDAAKLVNGNGGEWGYVTLVIREEDRDTSKWQRIFDKMRELKLIPIVRLATYAEEQNWAKPKAEDVDSWVIFLSSLNWVVKNRYVILFNEPNHSNEWGGTVSPEEYAKIVRVFYDSLKDASGDYFVLPAGFDVSVPNSKTSMDVSLYFKKMHMAELGIFKLFDGWSSHSYPNPNFSGSPYKMGRIGVQSYNWEVSYLSRFGLSQDIPIFITETGWIHKEGKDKKVLGLSSETVGDFFKDAYNNAWNDSRIVAVTPFVLNYQDKPFDQFSWKKLGQSEYYPQYDIVQNIPKIKGNPEQVENSTFIETDIPDTLISDSTYQIYAIFKNTGQSIWGENYLIDIGDFGKSGEISRTRPLEDAKVVFSLKTPSKPGVYKVELQLTNNGKKFGQGHEFAFKVISPVAVKVKAGVWKNDTNNFYFGVFDGSQIIESMEVSLSENTNVELKNVVVGKKYKFGLSKLYYPTKFETVKIDEKETEVDFGQLISMDFNGDGQFSIHDVLEGILHPLKTLKVLNIR